MTVTFKISPRQQKFVTSGNIIIGVFVKQIGLPTNSITIPLWSLVYSLPVNALNANSPTSISAADGGFVDVISLLTFNLPAIMSTLH